MKFISISIWLSALLLYSRSLLAADPLPYTQRTHSYSAWSSSIRGDIRTVGMAGATVGLANSFMASLDNPAGLAMTLNGADFRLVRNSILDGNVQTFNQPLPSLDAGFAFSHYPWGFSIGLAQPTYENEEYVLSSVGPQDPARLSLSTQEFRASIARVLFDNKLSLGLTIVLSQGDLRMSFVQSPQNGQGLSSLALGGSVGASYQLPHRILLGLSYMFPTTYQFQVASGATPLLPGFFQSINVPPRLGIGVGWIPSRFFQADFSIFLVGRTPGAALVGDNSFLVGDAVTVQPRFGARYQILDFQEFQSTLMMGTYLETSRILNSPNRLHFTMGLEVSPWIFYVGLGLDVSYAYQNYLISVGVNILKTLQKADLAPQVWHPPHAGVTPQPTVYSDVGLPRPLVKDWVSHGKELDIFQIGRELPKRIEKKAEQIEDQMKGILTPSSQRKNTRTPSSQKTNMRKPLREKSPRPTPRKKEK